MGVMGTSDRSAPPRAPQALRRLIVRLLGAAFAAGALSGLLAAWLALRGAP